MTVIHMPARIITDRKDDTMANFVIECPACKKPIQAGTGLFAKKKIKCSCGYVVDVSTERMAEDTCPHCGNKVIYDRSKSATASCPVCHTRINSGKETVKITCPACKVALIADKSAKTYTCPQCKTVIDVQARLAQEKSSGKTGVIKWDMGMNDIFVYRHPVENFNIGSQLIVSEGQKALFFRNGKGLDVFGPGRHILETQKFPLLEEVLKFPTNAELTFDSKIYFVRTNRLNVKWGVPEIRLRNPEMDFYVNIGISGSVDLQVIDDNESVRKLVYMIIGTSSGAAHNEPMGAGESYTAAYVSEKFRDVITSRLSDLLANIIIENQINVLDIESKKILISDILRKDLNAVFDEYGLIIPTNHFNLTTIKIHNSEDVERWRKQEAERKLKAREEGVLRAEAEARQGRVLVEEQTEAQQKILRTQGEGEATKISAQAHSEAVKFEAQGSAEAARLEGQSTAEAYSAQAMAEAEEMRAKGYTYGQETSRQIGLEAMQNGLPGTGNGTEGSAAGGLGGAVGNMVGLGVGLGAMSGVMNMTKNMMSPIMNNAADMGKQASDNAIPASNKTTAWNCSCGKTCITSKFCPECGAPKPQTAENPKWDCSCGCKGISTNFCPDCGAKRPEKAEIWNCPDCGRTNITSKFCPDCGHRKGE